LNVTAVLVDASGAGTGQEVIVQVSKQDITTTGFKFRVFDQTAGSSNVAIMFQAIGY
jgi:hypothetical protein